MLCLAAAAAAPHTASLSAHKCVEASPGPGVSSSLPIHSFASFLPQRASIRRHAVMASAATVTATMAAAGFDKKGDAYSAAANTSSSLQTPGSGTFPSELRSPMVYSPGLLMLKKEEALKTPITPPSAYLDFLKNMSPAMMSPLSTGTSTRFQFNSEKASDKSSDLSCDKTVTPPTSQPALSRNTSYDSNASMTSTSTSVSDQSTASKNSSSSRTRPESPRITIPPTSSFVRPGPRSSRTPRRLQIPQSPFSPAPGTANSLQSPYSTAPLSAAPWSASFSPRDVDPEVNGKPGKVSVRHVVTRTVTYCRTPLEPAPRGKRRKLDNQPAASTPIEQDTSIADTFVWPKQPDNAPVIKQEVTESDTTTSTPPTDS